MYLKRIFALLLALCLALGGGAWAESAPGRDAPSLRERYGGIFEIGAEVRAEDLREEQAAALLSRQVNILGADGLTMAAAMLDRSASIKSKQYAQAKISLSKPGPVLAFAQSNQLSVSMSPLIGAETPRWFFAEKWSNMPNAALVDRETMALRLENLIRDTLDAVNAKYPGVVSVWDVADTEWEADSLWEQAVPGGGCLELAFAFARQYAAEGQRLFSRVPASADASLLARLKGLKDSGRLDGVSLELAIDLNTDIQEYRRIISQYTDLGLALRLTLRGNAPDANTLSQMRLAGQFSALLSMLEIMKTAEGRDIAGVALAPFRDDAEIQNGLFSKDFRPKALFYGALQDAALPLSGDEDALMAAAEALGVYQEEGSLAVYKTLREHNPVMVQRFGADPWAMVYGDRVYLYMTGDEPVLDGGGTPAANNYGNITTLRVLSSADLVNWRDHGSINAAGRGGAAKWAANSWAPCAAWKNIGGQDKFFLYFANSGGGIGVLTADSPTGPFTDPLDHALISRDTPTCSEVTWLFDPAVLVDSDGSAYLYFGGGIPAGREADPGTARVVKLGDDMTSLDGDPVRLTPPWLFEDSGINKMGDTYVYSYCSNFNVPSGGSEQGFRGGEIVYMTADSPIGPFAYRGRVLQNPSVYFGVGGNNHHCMFAFQDKWYITYHAATVDQAMGWNAGYRSTFVDELLLDLGGLPALSQGTRSGVSQVRLFDPYETVNAAELSSLAGADTRLVHPEDESSGTGDMAVVTTAARGWIGIAGVDFGAGPAAVALSYAAPAGARVEILLDSLDSAPAAALSLSPAQEARTETFALPAFPSGVHDLYFRFSQPGVSLLDWQFRP